MTASSITTASATASPANDDRVDRLAEQVEHERRRDERERRSPPGRSATGAPARTATRRARARAATARDHDRERRGCRSRPSMKRRRAEDVRVDLHARRGPARRSSSASSTPSVTSSVLAPGSFSTTSSRPAPPLTTRVADQRLVVLDHRARRRPRRSSAVVPSTRHPWPAAAGVESWSNTCRTCEALVGRLDESAGAGRRGLEEASAARRSARCRVVATIWLERHALARAAAAGRPAPAAAARAGPRSRRWRRPGRPAAGAGSSSGPARDFSIGESACRRWRARSSARRLDDDRAAASCGGLETFGSACACVSRSWTSCAALEDVGAGLEDQHDRRQPGHRLRADHVDARPRR